ncbi:sigma-54-dependent Fis family transcriptional regulator [Fundidesulfovibrio putealis]|uniref:sigma-54-dependent Fis family transcriptional regulator n=1 Tax=Fundidesulfovibrio putealis TaxID=270496 RepID=UPI000410B5A8|nr:sigma-54-dependent Fis family transcriptional regulator [Fundidesulfovibrio putealis]
MISNESLYRQSVEGPFGKDGNRTKGCNGGSCREKIVPVLSAIKRAISGKCELSTAIENLLDYMRHDMGIDRAIINLYHQESGEIFSHKSFGMTEEEEDRGLQSLGDWIAEKVIFSCKPVMIPKICDDASFSSLRRSLLSAKDMKSSFFCIPIHRGKKVIGSISAIRHYDAQHLLCKHVEALEVVCCLLAQAMDMYLVENVDRHNFERHHREHKDELRDLLKPQNIIGASKAMLDVFAMLHKVAPTKTTVLVLGESGVGKEMIASAIHSNSPNADGPMVKFNCAALPESILESELFGHEKGSFTGAAQLRKGRFEEADGGTIFLDEVGELSLGAQAKLLRVLQERSFERVGGSKTVTVNLRVVAATNRDLAEMVRAGTFRQDLYFRLNVFPLMLPPLRERGRDVITLAEYFISKFAEENGKQVNRITTTALNMLMSYHWPGNVRELENVMERAVVLAEDDAIHGRNLPMVVQSAVFTDTESRQGLEAKLAAIEYEMLLDALRLHSGNLTRAAGELGLTRRTLTLRMKKYNMVYKTFRSGDD